MSLYTYSQSITRAKLVFRERIGSVKSKLAMDCLGAQKRPKDWPLHMTENTEGL